MPLTDASIKAAKGREKPYKMADGRGLRLLVTPTGSKLWQVKFRYLGKEKKLSLGAYPDVGLEQARLACDKARERLAEGHDPALDRKKAKIRAKLSAETTFSAIALEYIETKMVRVSSPHRVVRVIS